MVLVKVHVAYPYIAGIEKKRETDRMGLPGRFLDIAGQSLNALSIWGSDLLGLPKHPTMSGNTVLEVYLFWSTSYSETGTRRYPLS